MIGTGSEWFFLELENIVIEKSSPQDCWLEIMPVHRVTKRAYMGCHNVRRPVGGPKYRWSDEMEIELRAFYAENWEEIAQDSNNRQSLHVIF